ncbi:enoyl-CoA hydratase-related protein [Solirubrobacter ginsenosidimutans]|uniref:Enoyl-CoA hydratase-related protein n=1 Tax=Solirubrobacter ginsenosidimutans TaxID=490573 RepID=A0A9X3S465_9ACTN|nr:enoyl-CoA hydratase-related protein [Solirubrobacter ginsenosidimutans]MDA0160318.1 enoyl-CoA hydratase-related protein [Solirubrobacter ginsenosidimutans]
MYETLRTTRDGGALRIELHRPEALNAFTDTLASELYDAVTAAAEDVDVRVVVLSGAGRAFSAGADIKEGFAGGDLDLGAGLRAVSNPTILALRQMPKPVVAAVHGPAAGIGCSLALACDLIVAAESAYFLVAFSRIGLTTDGGASQFLATRVGHARAFRIALLAERIAAPDAHAWGLIDHVAPDDAHAAAVDDLVARLAAGPTSAYAATKRALNAVLYPNLEQQLELEATLQTQRGRSADFAEGVAAFVEKRTPAFTGS